MIDLQQFCSTSLYRHALHKPFSRGEFTYATNGHILVRVPRRPDVPEIDEAPHAERVVPDMTACEWRPIGKDALPDTTKAECRKCDGRGTKHNCPDCTCECETCGGDGKVEKNASVAIGPRLAAVRYAAMIQKLPAAEVAPVGDGPLIAFRFDGGIGVLVGLSRKYETHYEIEL